MNILYRGGVSGSFFPRIQRYRRKSARAFLSSKTYRRGFFPDDHLSKPSFPTSSSFSACGSLSEPTSDAAAANLSRGSRSEEKPRENSGFSNIFLCPEWCRGYRCVCVCVDVRRGKMKRERKGKGK